MQPCVSVCGYVPTCFGCAFFGSNRCLHKELECSKVSHPMDAVRLSCITQPCNHKRHVHRHSYLDLELPACLLALVEHALELHHLVLMLALNSINFLDIPASKFVCFLVCLYPCMHRY
jgi:hypothetical protein